MLVLKERKVFKAIKVMLVLKAIREPKAILALKDCKAKLGRKGHKVIKDLKAGYFTNLILPLAAILVRVIFFTTVQIFLRSPKYTSAIQMLMETVNQHG